jgi:Flp pilus assembly protein TadG
LLLLIVFGAIDLARAYHAQVTITNASREGARYAMRVNNLPGTSADKLAAIRQRTVDEAGASGITIAAANVTVNCNGGAYFAPCTSGAAIQVSVTYQFNLLMGAFFIPSFTLSNATEMVAP